MTPQEFDNQFYELRQVLGGYFHQFWEEAIDWNGENPNFKALIRFYKTTNSIKGIEQTAEDLRKFLSLELDEKSIHSLFIRAGIWYNPDHENMNYRQWLEAILCLLKEEKSVSCPISFKM
jgi:hypothetical protein